MDTPDDILAALFEELAEPIDAPAPGPRPEPQASARRARDDAARAMARVPVRPAPPGMERLTTDELRRAVAALAEEEDRMGWPDWWWDQLDSGQHRAIRALWAAVAARVVQDAANTHPTWENQRRDALAWLRGYARDRAFICSVIDLDPQMFSDRALAYAGQGGAS